MFSLFTSQEKKMRRNAASWLEVAEKVWHFRRDLLNDSEREALSARRSALDQALTERADAGRLKLGIEALEGVLRRTGGAIYPKTSLTDNIEFFLVAAIVILGIRTFFVQPFKIPTNSMWPTYNGMTPEVFPRPADEPGLLAEAARLAALGAWPHRLNAPGAGEVLVPVFGGSDNRGVVHCRIVPGRTWFVIPTKLREYTLLVGDRPVTVRLPMDFDFDWLVSEAFFPTGGNYSPRAFWAVVDAKIREGQFEVRMVDGENVRCLRTGRQVRPGERVLAFDELTGDQLFVDRFSYNFMRPEVGSGFVFRTGNIPQIARENGDEYYIKRLVGLPGDTLEVRGTTLWRNHAPITGAAAFAANAGRLGRYPGYEATGLLAPGATVQVEPGTFFAMGDNSPNSADGRVWGFVPAKDVVGRPIFVYYPFTSHWGPAR